MNCTPEKLIEELELVDVTDQLIWKPYEGKKETRRETPKEIGYAPWQPTDDESPGIVCGKYADGRIVFAPGYHTREHRILCGFPELFYLLHGNRLYRGYMNRSGRWSELCQKYDFKIWEDD